MKMNMIYTIDTFVQKVYEETFKVYDIFKNYFGEDFVDIQNLKDADHLLRHIGLRSEDLAGHDIDGNALNTIRNLYRTVSDCPFILVYWPRVTVTNEHDRSVVIQELYAKVHVTTDGTIPFECTFQLNRSRYSMEQYMSRHGRGYLHSHIPGIPKGNFEQFQNPCLGSGPIRGTINTLHTDCDETMWMLFCTELARYVTVESLTGGPYARLEEIGMYTLNYGYNDYGDVCAGYFATDTGNFKRLLGDNAIKDFIQYYLEHGHLKLAYKSSQFLCGMSYFDYMIDISNAFIDFYNEKYGDRPELKNELYSTRTIVKTKVIQGKFYSSDSTNTSENIERAIGSYICTFKGRRITLVVDGAVQDEETITTVLDNIIATHILKRILRVINYRFKNGNELCETESGGGEASSTDRKIRYL